MIRKFCSWFHKTTPADLAANVYHEAKIGSFNHHLAAEQHAATARMFDERCARLLAEFPELGKK